MAVPIQRCGAAERQSVSRHTEQRLNVKPRSIRHRLARVAIGSAALWAFASKALFVYWDRMRGDGLLQADAILIPLLSTTERSAP
jgi:hypothetical protein